MDRIEYTFVGMNNVDDPASVGAPVPESRRLIFTEGVSIINADPDNTGGVSLRPGQVARYAGNVLSMWGDDELILFHEGILLKRFWPETLTATTLRIGLGALQPAVFCRVNDLVVYTDGAIISRVFEGKDYPIPTPTEEFKLPVPPGQCLALFYRRLLIGSGEVLYISDPDTVAQMDSRLCQFPFGGRIKLIAPVDTGVYVGAGEAIYFLTGRGPTEWSQPGAVRKVASYAAIPGTAVSLKAELTDLSNAHGNITQFTTTRGICYGLNGREFVNVTEHKVQPPPGKTGCAVLREQNGLTHYLTVLRDCAAEPYNTSHNTLQAFI